MTLRKAAYFIALALSVLITGSLHATEPTTKFPAQDIAGLPFNDTALSKDDEDFVAMMMRYKGTLDGRPYQDLPVYLQQLYIAAHFVPKPSIRTTSVVSRLCTLCRYELAATAILVVLAGAKL